MVPFSAILPSFVGHSLTSKRFNLRLLEVLGTGAYGVVYLAHNISAPSNETAFYAVKCLLRHPQGSQLGLAQEREIELHKQVSHHPNIVTLHEVIEEEHYVFFVLDYCPNDLFSAITERESYLNRDDAIKKTFLQLLDAIELCHSLGIFHRDLKPENVLCSADDENVYIADFGLATKEDVSSTHGCGSYYYMSPECVGVITSKLPFSTPVSDLWSLGIILTNMITGRNPWHLACPDQDHGFRRFLQEGAPFLLNSLPLSRPAARLLVRIFDPDPETRITIPELRESIKEIQTFSDYSRPLFRLVAPSTTSLNESNYHSALTRNSTNGVLLHSSYRRHSFSPSKASIIGLAPSLGETPFSSFVNQSSPSFIVEGVDLDDFPKPPPLSIDTGGDSDTDAESQGPTTPITQPHDPAVNVPEDLTLGEGAGQFGSGAKPWPLVRFGGSQRQVITKLAASFSSSSSKFSRPVQRLVGAMTLHKAKGLA